MVSRSYLKHFHHHLITISAYKLTQQTMGTNWLMWVIYLASAATTMITESESILLFLGAGLIVWAVHSPPLRKAPISVAGAFIPLPNTSRD